MSPNFDIWVVFATETSIALKKLRKDWYGEGCFQYEEGSTYSEVGCEVTEEAI